jgi:hypothetical protein
VVYFLIFLALFVLLFILSRELTRSISLILFRITKSQKASIRIFHTLFLPGVLVHELSHLICAEVMFVKTHGLNLSLESFGNELSMGSVKIEKTDPIRRALIGFAPVFVGFLIISFANYYLLSDISIFSVYLSYALLIFIVFEIGNTMFSSRKDLEGTIELLIFFALLFLLAYILGFKFEGVVSFVNSSDFHGILEKGIKILLIPIAVDLVIIFTRKILFRKN